MTFQFSQTLINNLLNKVIYIILLSYKILNFLQIKKQLMFQMNLNKFDQVQSTLQLIRSNCKQITPHYKSIIFTGQTGSGKGTLIHFLLKNQNLYAQISQYGQMIIKCQQNKSQCLNQIKISQKMSSETSVPKSIQHKGQVFRDFPGFHDNRKDNSLIVQDIINQFYIAQVYKKTKQIKILFVSSRTTLNDRGQQFIHSIRQFIRKFDNIEDFINSICLVITKAEKQIQTKHIKASLEKIIQQMGEDLQKNQIKLLTYFSKTQHIVLFHSPQKQGKIDFSQSDKIMKMIKNLKFSKSPQVKIHFDNHSEAKMKSLLQNWNSYISEICEKYLLLQTYNFFQLYKKFHDVQKNQKNLINLGTYLDLLVNAQDEHSFLKIFTQNPIFFSERLIHKAIRNEIQKMIKFVTFFYFLEKQSYDIQKWKCGAHKLLSGLNFFLQQPVTQKHGKTFYLKGFFCDCSIIQKNIIKNQQTGYKPKNFIIFSYLLNLNSDIISQGTNLIIMTQNINIPQSIQINLRGKNGKDYQQQAAFNKNGLPGRPGQNGGNLIIRTFHHTIDQHKLCLDLRGGQGGNGQNGGKIMIEENQKWINKIKEDMNKNLQQKQLLVCRQTYKFSDKKFLSKFGHVLRVLGTYNDQILERYSTQKVNQSFFQTYGGCHGLEGKCGIVDIGKIDFKLKLKDQKTILSNFGYKETYQGIYVRQMIFPNLREAGKQILGCRKKSLPKKQQSQKNSRVRRSSIQYQTQKISSNELLQIPSSQNKKNQDFSNFLMQDLQMEILSFIFQQTKIKIKQNHQKIQPQQNHQNKLLNRNSYKKQEISHSQSLIHESNPQIIKQKKPNEISEKNIQFLNGSGLKQLIKQKAKDNIQFIKSKKDKDQFVLMISRQLLQEFGKQVATEVGTDVITGVGKNIIQNVGVQTIKSSTTQIGKQFITKGTSTLGAQFIKAETIKGIRDTITSESIKQMGNVAKRQSIKQMGKAATLQAAKTSLQGGSYVIETALGISKSMFLQAIVSAIMASGISDGWLIQPHLTSKKVQNGCIVPSKKMENIHKPESILTQQIQQLKQDFVQYIGQIKKYFSQLANQVKQIKKE